MVFSFMHQKYLDQEVVPLGWTVFPFFMGKPYG